MRIFAFIVSIALLLTVNGQQEYRWLNVPYASNNMSEYPFIDELLHFHGTPATVRQFIGHNNNPPLSRDLYMTFDEMGRISTVQDFQADAGMDETSSFTHYTFTYNAAGELSSEAKTHVDKGDTVIFERTDDISWFSHTSPEPIASNSGGYATVFTYAGDTTFSVYDEGNRKVLDSIPDSGNTMTHTIRYTYAQDSIVTHTRFPSEPELDHTTVYHLDSVGNWISKKTTYGSGRLFPVHYRRVITYYEP